MGVVLAGLWALIVVPIAFIFSGFTFLGVVLLGALPVTLMLYSKNQETAVANKHYSELLGLAGIPMGQGMDHFERGTAIAIDPKKRKVLLLVGKVAKTYTYEDIRGWSANKGQRSGGAVGYGMQGVLAAGARNIADANRADQETGLFIKVRDIEHAEWRISMFDGAARSRWMEILQQEINERPTGG